MGGSVIQGWTKLQAIYRISSHMVVIYIHDSMVISTIINIKLIPEKRFIKLLQIM